MADDPDIAVIGKAGRDLFNRRVVPAARQTTRVVKETRTERELLLDAALSLDAAMSRIANRQFAGNPAANSTVEALKYSLRSGAAVLKKNDVSERVSRLDEKQMHEVCGVIERWRFTKWSREDVKSLVALWKEQHRGE